VRCASARVGCDAVWLSHAVVGRRTSSSASHTVAAVARLRWLSHPVQQV